MKRLLVFVFTVVIISCNYSNRNDALNQFKEAMQQASSNSSNADTNATPKGWQYKYDIDKMTSDTEWEAYVVAKDKLEFSFPYGGGVDVLLFVTYVNGVNGMGVEISNGMYDRELDEVLIKIRFDDEKPLSMKTYMEEHGHHKLLFFANANTFIEKLKTSKKVLIEAPFYNEGKRVMEFDLDKIKWSYKDVIVKDTLKKKHATSAVNAKTTSLSETFMNNYKRNLAEIKAAQGRSNDATSQVQTREIIDRDNGTVTLICKYHNTGSEEKNITLDARFYDNNDKVVATKSVSLTCSGNASITSQIVADGLGRDYKTYKLDVE